MNDISNLNNLTAIDKIKDKIYNSFEKYLERKKNLYDETIEKINEVSGYVNRIFNGNP